MHLKPFGCPYKLLLLTILFFSLPVFSAIAATSTITPTPTNCATVGTNLNGHTYGSDIWNAVSTGILWINPANINSIDGAYAVAEADGQGWWDAGDPTGMTGAEIITGVNMKITWQGAKVGNAVSINFSVDGTTNSDGGGADTVITTIGSGVNQQDTVPLNASGGWTWAKVQNLRFMLHNTSAGGAPATKQISVEYIYIQVYYELCNFTATNTPTASRTVTLTPTPTNSPVIGAVNVIYRSVGPGNLSALATGAGNGITIVGANAFFAADLPMNVGVGDAVQYDSDNNGTIDSIAFITGRINSITYSVSNAAGGNAVPVAIPDQDWSIYRAYISLRNSESGVENNGINAAVRDFDVMAGGRDLVSNNEQWNIACYADGVDSHTVDLVWAGWATSADNYIRIFTPYLTGDAGASQRHNGKYSTTAYRIEASDAIALGVQANYIRIEGLQFRLLSATAPDKKLVWFQTIGASGLEVSDCIFRGLPGASFGGCDGLELLFAGSGVLKAWNNVFYDFSGASCAAIFMQDAEFISYIYNNTFDNCWNGLVANAGTVNAKNNIGQNCAGACYTGGAFGAACTNNLSSLNDAPGLNPRNSMTVDFADAFNDDYHLSALDTSARGWGTNLSGDAGLAFNDDVDRETRAGTWDIGADQYSAGATPTNTPTATACACEKQLGKTTIGSQQADISGSIQMNRYTLYTGTNFTASAVWVYVAATNGTAKMRAGLYNATGMNHPFIAEAQEITPIVGWNRLSIAPAASLFAGQQVGIAVSAEASIQIAYDTGADGWIHQVATPVIYGPMPQPQLSTDLYNPLNDRFYSVYIDYCPLDCNVTPTITGTVTPTETPTCTDSPTVSATYTGTATPTQTVALTFSATPTITQTGVVSCGIYGYSTIGAASWQPAAGEIVASRYYMEAGVTQGVTITVASGAAGQMQAAIYEDAAGIPGTLISSYGNVTAANGYNYFPINTTIPVSGYYWIAAHVSVSGPRFYYDTSSAGSGVTFTACGAYPCWPADGAAVVPAPALNDKKFTFFTRICAAGTATNTPTVSQTPTTTQTEAPAPTAAGYLGNQSVISATYSFFLNSAVHKMAYSFTLPAAKNLAEIHIPVQSIIGICPDYRVGIKADDGLGRPAGAFLGTGAVVTTLAAGLNVIPGFNVPLAADTVYHVVIEYDDAGTTLINGSNYAFVQHGTEPLHRIMPLGQRYDGAARALYNTGSGWVAPGRMPEFVLAFSDASMYGNPYTINYANNVYGGYGNGERFTVPSTAMVDRVGFYVARFGSVPADDLHYTIYDETTGAPVDSGVLWPAASSVAAVPMWVDVALSGPVELKAGNIYRATLLSPGAVSPDYYALYRMRATGGAAHNNITYDGISSYQIASSDTGGTWSMSNIDSDVGFRFSYGIPPTPTFTVTLTRSATHTVSPTRTNTPIVSATNTPTMTPTVTGTICAVTPLSFISYPVGGQSYVSVTIASGTASALCGSVVLVEVALQRQSDGMYWDFAGGSWSAFTPYWDAAAGTGSWVFNNMPVLFVGQTYTVLSRARDSMGNIELPGLGNTFSIVLPSPTITQTFTLTETGTSSNTRTITPTNTPSPTQTATACVRQDTSFNGVGYLTMDGAAGGVGQDEGRSVAIDGNGKIVIAGYGAGPNNKDMVVWRYNENGTPDLSFNGTGRRNHDNAAGSAGPIAGRNDEGYGLAIDANGKIVVAGWSTNTINADMVIWRFNEDGTLDTSFGGTGYVVHGNAAGGGSDDIGLDVAIDALNRIVVSGYSYGAGGNADLAVWRYNPNGVIDTTFNGTGYAIRSNIAGAVDMDFGWAVAVERGGKILVAGSSRNAALNDDVVLLRFNSDGSTDNTFNGTGTIIYGGPAAGNDRALDVKVDENDKIVVTGYITSAGPNQDMAVFRINSDGTPDASFNGGVPVILDGAAGQADAGMSLLFDRNRRIVISGYSMTGSNQDAAICRFNPDGTVDLTFNGTGYLTHGGAAGGNGNDYAASIANDSLNRIVGAGASYNGTNMDMAAWRIADGCSVFNTPTNTPSMTYTSTPSDTATPTVTGTITQTDTPSMTPTRTDTVTQTVTGTNTPSVTPTATPTVLPITDVSLTDVPSRYLYPGQTTQLVLQVDITGGADTLTELEIRNDLGSAMEPGEISLVRLWYQPLGGPLNTGSASTLGVLAVTGGNTWGSITLNQHVIGGSALYVTVNITAVPATPSTIQMSLRSGKIRFAGIGNTLPSSDLINTGILTIIAGTLTPTPTITPTFTFSPTASATQSVTETVTKSMTETITGTNTPTVTDTVTDTATPTVTGTCTPSVTATVTGTATETVTETATGTVTGTVTPTPTQTVITCAIDGTVTLPFASSGKNYYVIVDTDLSGSNGFVTAVPGVTSGSTTFTYSLPAPAGTYYIYAVVDENMNGGQPDNGDYVAIYGGAWPSSAPPYANAVISCPAGGTFDMTAVMLNMTPTPTITPYAGTPTATPVLCSVSGTITMPAASAGSIWAVFVDTDYDGGNGYAGLVSGTAGITNQINYSLQAPAGLFYLYAIVDADYNGFNGGLTAGDYAGFYGTSPYYTPPGAPNTLISCPSTGMDFEVGLMPTATETVTATGTLTATGTCTGTPTPSSTETATGTNTRTYTPTFTATDSPTSTGTRTATGTSTDTATPTATMTATGTPSETQTRTFTATATDTFTSTVTPTGTGTATDTATATTTWTGTSTPTGTQTATETATPLPTGTFTETRTVTPTVTETVTPPPTGTYTATGTATPTMSETATGTFTPTFTLTPTQSETHTASPTRTITQTHTPLPTPDLDMVLDKNVVDVSANESLRIRYRAPAAGILVRIKGYNLTGEMVRQGEFTTTMAGWNEIVWDMRNDAGKVIGQGMYFIRIEAQGTAVIRKVYIVK